MVQKNNKPFAKLSIQRDRASSAKRAPREQPKSQQTTSTAPQRASAPAAIAAQQRILNVFNETFHDALFSSSFSKTLQEMKQALYERDFAKAFERAGPRHLDIYAARWSPTRALCYADVLWRIRERLDGIMRREGHIEGGDGPVTSSGGLSTLRVLSIGGGAAELVAFGAFLRRLEDNVLPHNAGAGQVEPTLPPPPLPFISLTLLDSAPWASIMTRLHHTLTHPPPISKYASASARAVHRPLVSPTARLTARFVQRDALSLSGAQLLSLDTELHLNSERTSTPSLAFESPQPVLITLLFTLNELYTCGGVGKTTALLMELTSVVPASSLLLVIESPGSYSETAVGSEKKKYPVQWLLENVLLTTRYKPLESRIMWKKLESHDSLWFRLADSLSYPISLENMRYQMHIYQAEELGSANP